MSELKLIIELSESLNKAIDAQIKANRILHNAIVGLAKEVQKRFDIQGDINGVIDKSIDDIVERLNYLDDHVEWAEKDY